MHCSIESRRTQRATAWLRTALPSAGAVALAGALQGAAFAAPEFDCVIEPKQTVEIRTTVEGMIERVAVDRGDLISRGQVLVTLDAGVERAAASLAKQRTELEGAIRSAESRVDFSSKKHLRHEELLKQNFVSAQARDEAVTERRLAETEFKEAIDNRKIAQLEYARQMELLKLKTIVSPFNGVVVDRLMHPGEVAEAGVGRKPILKIAEIDVLHVEVILPVAAYGRVKPGSVVDVMPESPVGGSYGATVKVVDRVLDAASGTFGVRLELPNRQLKVPAGVRCRAKFEGIGDDLVVPASHGSRVRVPKRGRPGRAPRSRSFGPASMQCRRRRRVNMSS